MGAPNELGPESLRSNCDPDQFDFNTTADIADAPLIVGQPRATEALQFGVELRDNGYNIFALGPAGVGKRFLIGHFLSEEASKRATPPDFCYINNFTDPQKPRLLALPAGAAVGLKRDIDDLIDDIGTALPAAFETEEYQSRLHALTESIRSRPAALFEQLQEQAREKGLSMLQTPMGIAFAPARGGQVLTPEDFEKLSAPERERLQNDIEAMQEEVQKILRQAQRWERELHEKVRALNHEVASFAVAHLIEDVAARYREHPNVLAYLSDVQKDVTENAREFLQLHEEKASARAVPVFAEAVFSRRYRINVIVDRSGLKGAPVIYEDYPTYENLIGRIEHLAQMGTLVTDFNLIKAGALHRASGGYLIIDARKVLSMPFAWEALKRVLSSRQVRIEPMGQAFSMVSTVALEPEPAPLDAKVVLTGEREIYYLLCAYDPEFGQLFRISADFDDELERNTGNQRQYARLIAALIKSHELQPFDRTAVARVVEHSSRMASDGEKLSLNVGRISEVLCEAAHWSRRGGRDVVTGEDVQRAIDAQTFRSDRVRERIRTEILRNTIFIQTDGTQVGQVNGLSITQLGNFLFGRPVRITARVRPGKGEVVDIEREVELGGPLHSKGILILSGFLGAKYASDYPLALSASLVFEQSYSGVEGDSASSAELYALLSAIAQAPLRQWLAVTGSVNQHGQVQPIGGVNEKIEGFYDVCSHRGLNGQHGVLIPASNVKHLMLRHDVVDAVREGRFHVYPIETIDQGIEILTGLPAGDRDSTGAWPAGTIGRLVQERLLEMARKQVAFAKAERGEGV
jgi:lon-related putative ATP-dependent protease